jgi:GxxExxY protein
MTHAVKENEVSGDIIKASYKVHTRLGPGLLESVYEAVLAYELEAQGHRVERQVPIGVRYDAITFDIGFRADLIVDELVIVELKSVEQVLPVHKKQVLTYIRLADKRLGLLLNFGAERIRDGITRVANNLPD